VYVDLPEVGARVEAEQPLGEVESTKSVSDVFSPLAGTIVERNPLIDEHPELVNEQPYGDGWLVVLAPDDASKVDGLLDAGSYRDFSQGT
jgi:glycine cleavage system H protein